MTDAHPSRIDADRLEDIELAGRALARPDKLPSARDIFHERSDDRARIVFSQNDGGGVNDLSRRIGDPTCS
jgi:hypothetical protein